MVIDMTKFVHQYNAQILPPVWQLLTQMADIYVKVIVNELDSNKVGNDDDELNNFVTLILQLFEFIHAIIEEKKFGSIVESVLIDLVYISIIYMQINEEQINFWSDDAEPYVDDFNDEIAECTIRVSSKEVLVALGTEFSDFLLPALSEALSRHISVAEAEKNAGNKNWWKIVEASVVAVGSLKDTVLAATDEEKKKFNLKEYLMYVKTMLGQGNGYQGDASPFLHGKCLWVLARYGSVDIYDRPTLQAILDCIAANLSAEKPMPIQISAMRSLLEVCEGLKTASDEQRAMVVEKLPVFLNFIIEIAPKAKGSILSDVLLTISSVTSVSLAHISLYTLNVIFTIFFSWFQFDTNFTTNNHSRIISFTIATFLKYYEDPFILEQVHDIIQALAKNEFCIGTLQERLVPTLVSIIGTFSVSIKT